MNMPMMPMLPPKNSQRDMDEIEKESPFVTYAWGSPLCPWCGSWLRQVNMMPRWGIPFIASHGCPSYHGMTTHGGTKWADFKPPKVERGGDGAWWSEIEPEHYAKWRELNEAEPET